jgi:Family of unknown function (DUF6281)
MTQVRVTGLLALAFALGLAGCGSDAGSVSGEASCALVVRYGGHTYIATGVEVAPPEGTSLGRGTLPACNDTGDEAGRESGAEAEIAELEGVDPSVALVLAGRDDVVLIRDDIDSEELPAEVTRLLRAAECDPRDEPIELGGRWLGIIGADGKTELDLVPPYDLEILVEDASSQRYENSHLTIRVPAELGQPLSREDVRSSLWEGGTISLEVTCRDGQYVAEGRGACTRLKVADRECHEGRNRRHGEKSSRGSTGRFHG